MSSEDTKQLEVGDVVFIRGIGARPHRNGELAEVRGWDAQQNRHDIVVTTGRESTFEYKLKPKNLELAHPLVGEPATCLGPSGTVAADATVVVQANKTFRCGVKALLQNCTIQGASSKVSTILGCLSVGVGSSVVLEDLCLLSDPELNGQDSSAVLCDGGTVTLRRCRLSAGNLAAAVIVLGGLMTLEDCVIEQCKLMGALVRKGHLILTNCTIQDTAGCAIQCRDKGQVTATECTMNRVKMGVLLWDSGSSLLLDRCDIKDTSDSGVLLDSKDSSSVIRNCTITDCKAAGVSVEGGSDLKLTKTAFSKTREANLLMQTGNSQVTVSGCSFHSSKAHCAISLSYDLRGSVRFQKLKFKGFKQKFRIVDETNPGQCSVHLDGKLLQNQNAVSGPAKVAQEQSQPRQLESERKQPQEEGSQGNSCGYCKKAEPADATFPSCSRCRVMIYCSPVCQRAHWKTHKPSCVKAT
jgi:hypothetical protein